MYVLFTVDCESPADNVSFEDSVFAEISGKNYGVGLISDILGSAGFRGTFFLDTCAEKLFGEETVLKAARFLSERNQDVQVHAHPRDGEFCEISKDEKKRIIERGCNIILKATGKFPSAFRAGSYMMDEESLPLLKEYGINADCSNYFDVSPLSVTKNSVEYIEGMYEIPVSFFRLYISPLISFYNNVFGKRVFYGGNCKIDINWMNIKGMKRMYNKFLSSGNSIMIVFLHSFSFINWQRIENAEKDDGVIRKKIIKRFEEFVAFLSGESDARVITVSELTDLLLNNEDVRQKIVSSPDYVPSDIWGIDTRQLLSSIFLP